MLLPSSAVLFGTTSGLGTLALGIACSGNCFGLGKEITSTRSWIVGEVVGEVVVVGGGVVGGVCCCGVEGFERESGVEC